MAKIADVQNGKVLLDDGRQLTLPFRCIHHRTSVVEADDFRDDQVGRRRFFIARRSIVRRWLRTHSDTRSIKSGFILVEGDDEMRANHLIYYFGEFQKLPAVIRRRAAQRAGKL